MTTRREFAAGLAAGMAGMALPARAAAPGRSVFGGVEVGVQSYTFRAFTLERMIAALNSIGITSLELWKGHLDPTKASEADFRAVRSQLDAAGITVNAYCANFPSDASDEHLERAFRGARLLGTRVMTSSCEKPLLPRLDRGARSTACAWACTTTGWATAGSRATRRSTSRARPTSWTRSRGARRGWASTSTSATSPPPATTRWRSSASTTRACSACT